MRPTLADTADEGQAPGQKAEGDQPDHQGDGDVKHDCLEDLHAADTTRAALGRLSRAWRRGME